MTTAAPLYELVIPQGATVRRTLTLKDSSDNLIDLTGYSARLQVREQLNDQYPVIDISSDDPSPGSGDGSLTLGGALGTITLEIPADVTAALDYDGGVYDLEIEDGAGVVTRLIQGPAPLDREVTR